MLIFPMEAIELFERKTESAKNLRQQEFIPVSIYRKQYNGLFYLQSKPFHRLLLSLGSDMLTTIHHLRVNNKDVKALIKEIQFHPVTEKVLHIDFLQLEDGDKFFILAKVEIVNRDQCQAVRDGGIVYLPNKKVKIVCSLDSMHPVIKCDIKNMHKGSVLMSSDLKSDIVFTKNIPLVSILKE